MEEYAKAEAVLQRALTIQENRSGADPLNVVPALNRLAELYIDKEEYAKAEAMLQRALPIQEKKMGSDHPDIVPTRNRLAELYIDKEEYAKAEAVLQRTLAIQEKRMGPDHPDAVPALNALGTLYETMEEYTKGETALQRALAIREKSLGPDHPDVVLALNNLGSLYRTMEEYARAEAVLQRALAIYERTLGPNNPRVATVLWKLGALYRALGEYEKAETVLQRALTIYEKVLGPDNPRVATALNSLAKLYRATGWEYAKAEPLLQRALAIYEKALDPNNPSVATSLNSLAVLYTAMGEYAKAESLYRRTLAIDEKALGPNNTRVATALNSLGVLYTAMGDYTTAKPLLERALAINEKALGTDKPRVATALNSLGRLYRELREYAKAEPLLDRALTINEKALGTDKVPVATTLNDLARLYTATGEYAKAEPLYRRALGIYEKARGPVHPSVATVLNNLARLYTATGEYAKAEPLYRRALGIFGTALGPDHSNVATGLANLAGLAVAQQDYKSAFGSFKEGLGIQERLLQNVFTFTTEEQKLKFVRSTSGNYLAFLSMIHQHFQGDREAVRDSLAIVLRRKGIVFDAQTRARDVLQGSLSETTRKEWDRLTALRTELAQLLLNKPKSLSVVQYQEKLASLQRQIDESEQSLARESGRVARELQQRTLTVEALAKALPKNSALVEFVKIQDHDFAKGKWKPSGRYLAFVINEAGNVNLVDLGEASALESQMQRVLQDIKVLMGTRGLQIVKEPHGRDPIRQSPQSLNELYNRLWVPLEKALGGAEKVLISPDGLLNLMPFAALRDDKGTALVERYQLAYVSSGREVITTRGEALKPEGALLLVANPAYDQKVQGSGSPIASLRSRNFRGTFTSLPGTEREAKEIPPLVSSKGGQKLVLEGANATEGAVKTARSPRILHLATHGFFLQDEEIILESEEVILDKESIPDEATRGISVVKKEQQTPSKHYENPLVRSGLAFAGANHASAITEGDDGILTALEITGMDLYGTELVVLSACESGVGDVQTGEGVFGLRRAFALAGAKNLMMSLWAVSDEITANQMKAFYQNLQKLPPAEALRQAQLETIKELKAKDGIASPALWAPFILQGGQALGQ